MSFPNHFNQHLTRNVLTSGFGFLGNQSVHQDCFDVNFAGRWLFGYRGKLLPGKVVPVIVTAYCLKPTGKIDNIRGKSVQQTYGGRRSMHLSYNDEYNNKWKTSRIALNSCEQCQAAYEPLCWVCDLVSVGNLRTCAPILTSETEISFKRPFEGLTDSRGDPLIQWELITIVRTSRISAGPSIARPLQAKHTMSPLPHMESGDIRG